MGRIVHWRDLGRLLGTSRHSALPELRERIQRVTRPVVVRAVALGCGSVLIGMAVGMLVQANFGLPPYDVLSSGLRDQLGVTLGQAGWLVALVLFTVATLVGRRPSLWGIAYMGANGLAIDGTGHLLNAPGSMVGRIAFLLAAVVVMAVGINVVLYSGTTGGPFELLMLAGEDRGLSRTTVRYVLDAGVLALGVVVGGEFGIGTVIYGGLMGLTLQGVSQALSDYDRGKQLRVEVASGG